jgi:hypothetical protein
LDWLFLVRVGRVELPAAISEMPHNHAVLRYGQPETRFAAVRSNRHRSSILASSAFDVARKLNVDIADGATPFTPEEYDPDIPEVLLGAGCWAGAFPARGGDIAALVASSLAIIEKIVADGRQSRGAAYVLRRHAPSVTTGPLVELAFQREYR